MPLFDPGGQGLDSLGVGSLFPKPVVLEDTNGDGYPDRLNLRIGVAADLADARIWAAVLNLVARLAGETLALDLPVAVPLDAAPAAQHCLVVHSPLPGDGAEAELKRVGSHRVALSGTSPPCMADVVNALAFAPRAAPIDAPDWSKVRVAGADRAFATVIDREGRECGRLRLRRAGGTPQGPCAPPADMDLLDLDKGLYRVPGDAPRVKHLLLGVALDRARLSASVGFALADLVALAVLGATAFRLPLAFSGRAPHRGVLLRVRETVSGSSGIRRSSRATGGCRVIRAEGRAAGVAACIRAWGRFGFGSDGPGDQPRRRVHSELAAVRGLLTGADARGAWAERLVAAPSGRADLPPAAPDEMAGLRRACRALDLKPPVAWSDPGLRFAERWASEVRRTAELVSRVPGGTGRVEGMVLVSKPQKARRQLKAELERILRAKGYRPRVTVLNAYKSGLCWLLEVVGPSLKKLPGIARLELAYRPFPAGTGTLEMESRFLQEVYPGPDLLARSLGWPAERIRLVKRPGLMEAYRLRAWDGRGRRVLEAGFTPRWTRLPYLPGRPDASAVHPACGGVLISRDGRVLLEEDLATDREVFWRLFQERWLPALESAMAARLGGPEPRPPAVFWEEVRFEVAIDESDCRLPIGEERVAPMEALHEDLYFVLLDFYRIFVEEHGLSPQMQFGRIFPRVHAVAPGGRPSARMTARPCPPALQAAARGPEQAPVQSFSHARGALLLGCELPAGWRQAGRAERLCRVARAWGHDLRPEASGGGVRLRISLPPSPRPSPKPRSATAPPPAGRRFTLSEVRVWLERLGRLPHLRAWCAGTTWQGRPMEALEAVLAGGGGHASLARLRLLKPTLLVNARHHANEVSSTNAALGLAWELAMTAWGRESLKRVNVALVPLENADGVATLEALLPGAADHKLHAARYNALGVEWYADYFSAHPRFPEARVKPRLWRRWLPLLVLDAHGVPSHEWDQPFSGYAPLRFRPYWIPRAFIFAILPFLDRPDHPGHRPAKALVRTMARALADDPDITALNRELTGRYRRYALRPEPGSFPPVRGKSLVAVPSEERVAGLNFGVQRFPVTVSEIITEVTDEVVSGRLLELCARGHLKVAKALIEYLGRQPPGRLVRTMPADGGLLLAWEPGICPGMPD